MYSSRGCTAGSHSHHLGHRRRRRKNTIPNHNNNQTYYLHDNNNNTNNNHRQSDNNMTVPSGNEQDKNGDGDILLLEETTPLFVPRIPTTQEPADGGVSNNKPITLRQQKQQSSSISRKWFPGPYDHHHVATNTTNVPPIKPLLSSSTNKYSHHYRSLRSWKRRIFLILTEPETSLASATFFAILFITITIMNIVMILQTIPKFQFTPNDCRSCGGPVSYVFDDDDSIEFLDVLPSGVACQCPPSPVRWTVWCLNGLVYFFTLEWIIRICTFEPPRSERAMTFWGRCWQWFQFLTSTSTILDALAVFPYYMEKMTNTNGLMSLRLLRLFRVFQLVRLGQYNDSFMSLTAVMLKSLPYLKLLLGVMLFGAAFFGSMIYWVEKGEWKYWNETQSYQFIRQNQYGEEEISPFTSIPSSFWWFVVTTTTVGYGDTVPTSTTGKWVASVAMLMGVLVIAFPVSVFSDLWHTELRKRGSLFLLDDDDDDDDVDEGYRPQEHLPETFQQQQQQERPLYYDNTMVEQSLPHRFSSPGSKENHKQGNNNIPVYTTTTATSKSRGIVQQQQQGEGDAEDNDDGEGSIDSGNHVMMDKDDLAELAAQMQSIHEAQRNIRAVLRKYKIHSSSFYNK